MISKNILFNSIMSRSALTEGAVFAFAMAYCVSFMSAVLFSNKQQGPGIIRNIRQFA
ncbi:MAG: hypothetical protein J6J74_00955 [Elusimicrobiaceae bacterium]|nr:hypothetical protein [Elusimicrobiaceae bacterium]